MTIPARQSTTAQPDPHDAISWWARPVLAGWLVVGLVAALTVGVAVGLAMPAPGAQSTVPVPAPDSVETGFAQDMIVHHLQAVEMADVVMRDSADPEIRVLAYDIFTGQTAQIGEMQGWLNLWGRPALPTGGSMKWMPQQTDVRGADQQGSGMHGRGMHSTDQNAGGTNTESTSTGGEVAVMPGMASAEELAGLRAAPPGPQRDGLFLQLMLRHHRGGAAMLEVAAARADNPVVANFAGQLAGLQQHETDVMTSMMTDRGVQPLPS